VSGTKTALQIAALILWMWITVCGVFLLCAIISGMLILAFFTTPGLGMLDGTSWPSVGGADWIPGAF
jgi:hypothetical protein